LGGIGTFTISNILTLAGITRMDIAKVGPKTTNDLVTGVSALAYGGSLVVSNQGGTFSEGDSFRLFSATTLGGAFAGYSLPVLPAGLAWNVGEIRSNGTLRVAALPTILAGPQSLAVTSGAPAAFGVSAGGTGPLAYQWLRNGAALPGATNSSFALAATTPADAADYAVVVTNLVGAATSAVAPLTVLVSPVFTLEPTNVLAGLGSETNLTAEAVATPPPTYEWFHGTNLLVGETRSSLALTNLQLDQYGPYFVVARNPAGAATSAVAIVTVIAPPTLLSDPVSQTVTNGDPATFTVAAEGFELAYQWFKENQPIPHATNHTFTLPAVSPSDAGDYLVRVSNLAGLVTSAPATLTVWLPPALTPPALTGLTMTPAGFTLVGVGQPNQAYLLLASTQLDGSLSWLPIATNIADAQGRFSFSDPLATELPSRFYLISTP
jgi:hypothetical protein